MDLEKMAREGERAYAKRLRRLAEAVHEGGTERVRVKVNELHHLVGLVVAPALVEDGNHAVLEAEVLEAINRVRELVDEATGSGDAGQRMHQIMASSVMGAGPPSSGE